MRIGQFLRFLKLVFFCQKDFLTINFARLKTFLRNLIMRSGSDSHKAHIK